MLVERVRTDFHRYPPATRAQHLAHHLLDLHRFRRRTRRGNNALADLILHRAQQSGADARLLQDGFDHEGRRRFAVGAGHANDFQLLRGMIVETGRSKRHGPTRVGDPDPRRARIESAFLFEHHGGRTAIDGGLHKTMSIGA